MESLREINNLETYVGCNWRFVLIRDSLKCFNQVHFVSHIISISMNDYFQFETHRESFKSSHFERRAASFSSQNLEMLTENIPFERSRSMRRLNAGIFRNFELSEWSFNLNYSDCRASKMIWNHTKLKPISQEMNIENWFLNFCVGEYPRENF